MDKKSPYPPNMKGEDSADELTQQALKQGISADDILQKGLVSGMGRIGDKFKSGKAFNYIK